MSTQEEQQNLAVVTEYFAEYWGKANANIVDKLCGDNFDAAKKMLQKFKEAFPDISFHAYQHPLIASGLYVVGRWIGGGTHSGVAFHDLAVGSLDHPNTGKKMYFSGITIFTLKDGKIVDETGEEGALTALQQLGLINPPNPGKEIKYLHE
ncbi:hypothetical protein M441DRAFT_70525 [Trichoderma asperellum CBS 433.97]|uniref:SnoaL-like domain-containing protein n=1 Tax=Trichoderma asperellum (strain ATCC 204424 / CBS 433.97 / NBRC 101777) TaxID=1042311 RepID=A0A2T3Z3L8_TRIA4|nr:hypothetical protein M441DRAFT_70525 [Trichoderma asperellum CBS 433.97]PTB39393.1 hypothetical protein M441DRAFT_70525 [Trichoderma asperellum CBS 433.97]